MDLNGGTLLFGGGASTGSWLVNVGSTRKLQCWEEVEYVPAVGRGGIEPDSGVIANSIVMVGPWDK